MVIWHNGTVFLINVFATVLHLTFLFVNYANCKQKSIAKGL